MSDCFAQAHGRTHRKHRRRCARVRPGTRRRPAIPLKCRLAGTPLAAAVSTSENTVSLRLLASSKYHIAACVSRMAGIRKCHRDGCPTSHDGLQRYVLPRWVYSGLPIIREGFEVGRSFPSGTPQNPALPSASQEASRAIFPEPLYGHEHPSAIICHRTPVGHEFADL
jgi:hypothetical protein